MSAGLVIELDTGPIERARVDLVIVGFATTDRPLRGAAGQADWRLCGRLSKLIAAGRRGSRREAVLLPGGGGLRARSARAGPRPGCVLGRPQGAFAATRVRGLAARGETRVGSAPGELGSLALRLRSMPC